MRTSRGFELYDELDSDNELLIEGEDCTGCGVSTWINKADAIQIVAHLTRVFELVPVDTRAIGRTLRKIDTPVDVSHIPTYDIKRCYQCDTVVNWLAPDSRCGKCTRLTPEEIHGGD